MEQKNSVEVGIAPASGKITKVSNIGQGHRVQCVPIKGMSRTITMQGFTLVSITGAEKNKLRRKKKQSCWTVKYTKLQSKC